MFFNLNLIQSYGSGIRRAKKAMADNGSPELVFEPMNDTDELTMVTACINQEFFRIRQEEEKAVMTQEMTQENSFSSNLTQEMTQENAISSNLTQEMTQENSISSNLTQEMAQENVWEDGWIEQIEDPLERKIIKLFLRTPEITRMELAQILDVSEATINYRLRKLRNSGLIEHQGSTKAGKWVITGQPPRDDS